MVFFVFVKDYTGKLNCISCTLSYEYLMLKTELICFSFQFVMCLESQEIQTTFI